MREVAKHLNEDVDSWSLSGLLHDIDYEKTENDPKNQGYLQKICSKGKSTII